MNFDCLSTVINLIDPFWGSEYLSGPPLIRKPKGRGLTFNSQTCAFKGAGLKTTKA
jgi:hypothetical protein